MLNDLGILMKMVSLKGGLGPRTFGGLKTVGFAVQTVDF